MNYKESTDQIQCNKCLRYINLDCYSSLLSRCKFCYTFVCSEHSIYCAKCEKNFCSDCFKLKCFEDKEISTIHKAFLHKITQPVPIKLHNFKSKKHTLDNVSYLGSSKKVCSRKA